MKAGVTAAGAKAASSHTGSLAGSETAYEAVFARAGVIRCLSLKAQFDFAQCPVTWSHRIWGAAEYATDQSNCVIFYGEKETIFVTDDRWEVLPKGNAKAKQVNREKADAGKLHMAEFLKAVSTRQPPGCLIEDAFQSTATVKLAMIAYETGCRVSWDAQREEIPDNPAAAKLLQRDYRKPWKHPSPA